jgi:hypothetical protein
MKKKTTPNVPLIQAVADKIFLNYCKVPVAVFDIRSLMNKILARKFD